MATAKLGVEFNPVITSKVDAALARLQSKAKGIDFGGGAKSLDKLSRPLGRITGQANEFQKSLEASNARVLAFGASVAVINKLSQAFSALVSNTIKVEATFAKINTILGGTRKELELFGNGIFKVAQQTGTSFDQVADGALELARQGLGVEESLSRVATSLKLVRVSGIDAEKAVGGLTAAIKGFEGAGLTVAQIADKLAEVDTKFAVSTEDLVNGLERASASARVAGVSLDELLAVVTTVQERTQRGGAVIGNAFKTIFARLGRSDTLKTLENLGIEVLDVEGNVRDAIPLFKDLAVELERLGIKSVEAGNIIQKVAGVRQRDILISLVEDLNSGQSQFAKSLEVSAGAAGSLDSKNKQLNKTLESLINNLTVGGQKLASVLGEIGFTDAAKDILKVFSSVVSSITDILQGDSIGNKFAQGLVKGIGSVLTGPGLALIGAIFIKLFVDLTKFGASSLKSILGINKAAQQQQALQQSVLQTLFQNENIQREIIALEGNKIAQEQLLLKIYNQQIAALAKVQKAAATVTPGLFGAGLRGGEQGVVRPSKRAADGYISAESRDVSRGVGGAPSSAKVVSIPNFAFGGGRRGTMVANSSEYIVPNFAGGGDAIFNQNMVKAMGLPSGAKKLNAAGGFIPNFAKQDVSKFGFLVPEAGANRPIKPLENVKIGNSKFTLAGAKAKGIVPGQAKSVSDPIENRIRKSVINQSTAYANELKPLGRTVSKADIESGFGTIAGAKGALQAAIGAAFEVGITKSLDYKAASREKGGDFDIRGGVNLPRIQKLFGLPATTTVADLKVSDSPGNVESFYSKIMKELGAGRFDPNERKKNARNIATQQVKSKYPSAFTSKGDLKRQGITSAERTRLSDLITRTSKTVFRSRFGNASAAEGYIPNFADGALDEAVAREQAAGLPINQIRINQSGKLRNSQNPQGLAVTNTRDEPTGRIPNFARRSDTLGLGKNPTPNSGPGTGTVSALNNLQKSADAASGGLDNSLTKIFALQIGLSALTQSMTKQEGTFSRVGEELSSLVNTLLVLQVVGASPKIPGLGKGGIFAKFLPRIAQMTKGFSRFIPYVGTAILLFSALNSAVKVITGKSLFEKLAKALGLAADATEEFRDRVNSNGDLGKLKTESRQNSVQIRASSREATELKQQFINQKKLSLIQGKGGIDILLTASKIKEVNERIFELKKQQKIVDERIASLSKQKAVDAKKEREETISALEAVKRIQSSLLDRRSKVEDNFSGFSGKDFKRTTSSGGISQSGITLARSKGASREQLRQLDYQEKLLEIEKEFALAKEDSLKAIADAAISTQNLNDVEVSIIESIKKQIELGESFETIQASLAGLSGETLNKFLKQVDSQELNLALSGKARDIALERAEAEKKVADAQAKQTEGLGGYINKTKSDLANFSEELPVTLAENLETSLAGAFDNISDGAYDSLGDVFRNVALDFTKTLQTEINRVTAQKLAVSIAGGGGGGGGDSLFGKATSGIGSFFGGGGGGGGGGGFFSSIRNFLPFNSGGIVTGGSGVRDDVPAKLTGGEYVIKKSAVQKYGQGFLDQLNSSNVKPMQSGGFFTPGTRGQGTIEGEKNLLKFAQQEYTSGKTDVIKSSGSGAYIDLEQQSARLTTFGRFRDSPARRALKAAQGQAFDLYKARIEEVKRAKEAREQYKDSIKNAYIGAAFSGLVGGALSGSPAGGAQPAGGLTDNLTQQTPSFNTGAGTSFSTDLTPKAPSFNTGVGTNFSPNFTYGGGSNSYANGGPAKSPNAILTGGEYVMSAASASLIGREGLDNINNLRMANGGSVGSLQPISPGLSNPGNSDVGGVNITINMDKEGSSASVSNSQGESDPTKAKDFARKIKEVVVNVINEEKRVSGSLYTRRK